MRDYAFRLATVLRVRRVEALVQHQRVAGAARSHRDAETRANDAALAHESAAIAPGEREVSEFLADLERSGRLGEALRNAIVTRQEMADHLAAARVAALAAQRRVAVLSHLDERRREEWVRATQREDTAILDDFSTVRAARTAMERDGDD